MYILTPASDGSLCAQYVDGKIGMRLETAKKLSKEIDEAMIALREVRRLFGNDWLAELKRFEELVEQL